MSELAARAKAIFLEAIDNYTPEQWAAYMNEACNGDPSLRARVQQLLQAQAQLGTFHEVPRPSSLAASAEPLPEPPGTVLGSYKLLERIGEGGMGVVYVALQEKPVRRKVALKLIKPGMDSQQVIGRFEAERQALALMEHPNIARVLDAGTTVSGRPYFVMELVCGLPLTEYCDQVRLSLRERLALFVHLCQAIQHAHHKGIIHRDIKPSNVLVTLYDDVPVPKVIDFGIAKALHQPLTEHSVHTGLIQVVGSPLYMSPEQGEFSALEVDTRSDVYSLGVLLYELMTGTTPFDRERLRQGSPEEVRRLIREEAPLRPSARLSTLDAKKLSTLSQLRGLDVRHLPQLLRGELDWIVMKALEKDRNRRYESASAFAADVQRYLDDEPVQACPPTTAYRVRKFVGRHRGPVLAAALLLLAVAGGMIGTTWGMVRATAAAEQRQRAEQAAKRDRDAAMAAEADTRAFSDFLVDHVLTVARPKGVQGGLGIDVTVAQALEAAEGRLKEVFAGRPKAEATARHALGETWENLGRYGKAEEHLRRAMELREQELGLDAKETLQSGSSLARTLYLAGRVPEAVLLHEQVLNKRRVTLGLDDPATLNSMNDLAGVYKAVGRMQDALLLNEQALEKLTATLGPNHPDTLGCMNNLALLHQSAGRLQAALVLHEQALKTNQTTLGPDHPDTLVSMNNLAAAYHVGGRSQDAAALFEQTLEKRKVTLGPDHPKTLMTMENLGVAYQATGRVQEALVLKEQVLEKLKATLGPDHPNTLLGMKNLACAYLASDRLQEATALYEQTLEKRKATLGPDHGSILWSMYDLADAYLASGRLQDAVPLFEQTLEKCKARLGPEDELSLLTMSGLAVTYQKADKLDQAERLFREVLELRRKKDGSQSEKAAWVLGWLGWNLLRQQKYREAEPFLRESLSILEQRTPDDVRRSNALSLLGAVLLGQQEYAAAEPLLLQGYEGMKQREATISAQDKLRQTQALERLVHLYEATNQPEKARTWQAKLPSSQRPED